MKTELTEYNKKLSPSEVETELSALRVRVEQHCKRIGEFSDKLQSMVEEYRNANTGDS